jgi:hypothetical protein
MTLILSATFPPLKEASPRRLTRFWHNNGINCVWRAQSFLDLRSTTSTSTASAIPGDNHRRPRMKPRLHTWTPSPWAPKRLKLKKTSRQTPESLHCHHFVTGSGHPSRCWICTPQLSLRDQELLPEKHLLYCSLHYGQYSIGVKCIYTYQL